jgi:hypothetical protein
MVQQRRNYKMTLVLQPYTKDFTVNGKVMKFPLIVYSAVVLADRIIVAFSGDQLSKVFPNFDYQRAIWCYDLNGNILWKVEKPYYIDKNTGEKVSYDQPIDVVGYNDETGKVLALSRRGYELDPYTGELSNDFDLKWK